jgi:hypothetical protein
MAYGSISGRARTNAGSPEAHAICDRCGFRYNFSALQWQYDWRGAALQNLRILVCESCTDTPQEQLRAIVVPADPTPIINARVEDFSVAETDYRTVSGPITYDTKTGLPLRNPVFRATEDGQNRSTQPIGAPVGLPQNAVMPLVNKVTYGALINALSVTGNGTAIVTVTCSSAHGLSTNDQISADGLTDNNADGFYSVIVSNPMAFTYQTNVAITSGALLTGTSRIITVLVGLPYNYLQIPLTGALK